jgi:hypothetical protein
MIAAIHEESSSNSQGRDKEIQTNSVVKILIVFSIGPEIGYCEELHHPNQPHKSLEVNL